jgi:hypothetical protein
LSESEMLAKDELIRDIRKGLAVLRAYIEPGGLLNLTDINVQAEDFVAGLLNAIHGWGLVNTNKATANYPCIDLIDEIRKIGVQVTSETTSAKVSDTVDCLNTSKLAGRLSQLIVFMVVKKQGSYTVKVTCPGVAFKWQDDVIDFDDALKAAQAISDLTHLKRVHQFVIESLPFFFPDRQLVQAALLAKQDPPLGVPKTDPKVSPLAFSSRAAPLIGRGAEENALRGFLDSPAKFSWWIMTGPAGAGKSRLALELCRSVAPAWKAGFFSRLTQPFRWSDYRPSQGTLIVVDYVSGRAAEAGETVLALSRTANLFQHPVRILLLEREIEFWWSRFCREESHSERAEIIGCQHGDPLRLSGLDLEDILALAQGLITSRNGVWSQAVARDFLIQLLHFDQLARPLFAMMVAEHMVEVAAGEATAPDLIRHVLAREAARRQALIQD